MINGRFGHPPPTDVWKFPDFGERYEKARYWSGMTALVVVYTASPISELKWTGRRTFKCHHHVS